MMPPPDGLRPWIIVQIGPKPSHDSQGGPDEDALSGLEVYCAPLYDGPNDVHPDRDHIALLEAAPELLAALIVLDHAIAAAQVETADFPRLAAALACARRAIEKSTPKELNA